MLLGSYLEVRIPVGSCLFSFLWTTQEGPTIIDGIKLMEMAAVEH